MNWNKNIKGYTLIELLVVVGLLGVLISGLIILINPSHQLAKGRDAQRKADIKTIQSALELHKADNGVYPPFLISNTGQLVYGWARAKNLNLNTGGITYLQIIPEGPGVSGSCDVEGYGGYVYGGNASRYTIFTNLENEQDPDASDFKVSPVFEPGHDTFQTDGITTTWSAGSCQGTYNYWVNSP